MHDDFVRGEPPTHSGTALPGTDQLFRQFAEASLDVLWLRDAKTLQWEYVSPGFEAVYGLSREQALAQNDLSQWADLILSDDRAAALAAIYRAREGERLSFEYRIKRPGDGRIRWLRSNVFPMPDQHGHVQWIGGIGRDISELKSATDHQRRLLAELQHRVRNTLAVIRSIVRRTGESSESVDDFASHLDGRINAFARVQLAATRDPLTGFDLGDLIAEELRACAAREGEQFELRGPRVRLKPKAAESIGLATHELATNAVKHGAFTAGAGHIAVDWRVEERQEENWLCVDWTESGMRGRPVEQKREGFGTLLLQQTLQYDLGARVNRIFAPDGFRCEMAFPLATVAS